MDWLTHVVALIDAEFAHPTPAGAMIIGFACSVALTQFIKKVSPLALSSWKIRALAFVLAAVPTYLLWPAGTIAGIIMAVAVGLISPTAYVVVMRVAVHFFPWLDPIVSANPATPPQPKA